MADTATEPMTSQDDQLPEQQPVQDAGDDQQPEPPADDTAPQAADDTPDTEPAEGADAGEPADDPVRRIERENAELKGQLEVVTQFLAKQAQPQQKPQDAPEQAPQYKRALRELAERYEPNSAQAQSARTLEKIMDAFMADLEPRLSRSEQSIEESQRQLLRAAAKAEESEAVAVVKQEFDANDAEIKAAREYAQKEYKRAAQAGEWPGSYQQLFERSILRQRHTARKQGAAKDKAGEQKRLAAQVRADPTAGAKASNTTGRMEFPPEALRDTQSLERFLRKQGLVVEG